MNDKFFSLPEEKRLAIINAGYRVFAHNSYRKSPVSEIAAKAGISKSLLFHYFRNKRSKDDILEIVIAIFLGITALATAWASWIGSLHGGNMSTNYTKSNNLSAEGNSLWNEALQRQMNDMEIWNLISDCRLRYSMQTQSMIRIR